MEIKSTIILERNDIISLESILIDALREKPMVGGTEAFVRHVEAFNKHANILANQAFQKGCAFERKMK